MIEETAEKGGSAYGMARRILNGRMKMHGVKRKRKRLAGPRNGSLTRYNAS